MFTTVFTRLLLCTTNREEHVILTYKGYSFILCFSFGQIGFAFIITTTSISVRLSHTTDGRRWHARARVTTIVVTDIFKRDHPYLGSNAVLVRKLFIATCVCPSYEVYFIHMHDCCWLARMAVVAVDALSVA